MQPGLDVAVQEGFLLDGSVQDSHCFTVNVFGVSGFDLQQKITTFSGFDGEMKSFLWHPIILLSTTAATNQTGEKTLDVQCYCLISTKCFPNTYLLETKNVVHITLV